MIGAVNRCSEVTDGIANDAYLVGVLAWVLPEWPASPRDAHPELIVTRRPEGTLFSRATSLFYLISLRTTEWYTVC